VEPTKIGNTWGINSRLRWSITSLVVDISPEEAGALDRYSSILAGERNPFTFTAPLIFPANACPGKYKKIKKAIENFNKKIFRNLFSS
jgi:hypothetical protein